MTWVRSLATDRDLLAFLIELFVVVVVDGAAHAHVRPLSIRHMYGRPTSPMFPAAWRASSRSGYRQNSWHAPKRPQCIYYTPHKRKVTNAQPLWQNDAFDDYICLGFRAREVSVSATKCTYRVERPHKLSTKEIFLGTVGNIICISTIASSQFLQITQPCWGGGKRGTRASAPCWSRRCHLRARPSLDSRRRRRRPLHCMRTHGRRSSCLVPGTRAVF